MYGLTSQPSHRSRVLAAKSPQPGLPLHSPLPPAAVPACGWIAEAAATTNRLGPQAAPGSGTGEPQSGRQPPAGPATDPGRPGAQRRSGARQTRHGGERRAAAGGATTAPLCLAGWREAGSGPGPVPDCGGGPGMPRRRHLHRRLHRLPAPTRCGAGVRHRCGLWPNRLEPALRSPSCAARAHQPAATQA